MEIAREIIAVLVVLGLLAASLYGLRRCQRPARAADGPLRAAGRLRLSGNLVLHLVDCGGERCLVAEHKASCSVVVLPPAHPDLPLPDAVCSASARPAPSWAEGRVC